MHVRRFCAAVISIRQTCWHGSGPFFLQVEQSISTFAYLWPKHKSSARAGFLLVSGRRSSRLSRASTKLPSNFVGPPRSGISSLIRSAHKWLLLGLCRPSQAQDMPPAFKSRRKRRNLLAATFHYAKVPFTRDLLLRVGPPRFELGLKRPKRLVLPLHYGPSEVGRSC